MPLRVLVLSLLSLLAGAAFTWGQAGGLSVEEALTRQPTARVIVALRPPATPPRPLAAWMAALAAIRQSGLARLRAEEFTLTHQWAALSGFAGDVRAGGLATLRAHPDVLRVDLDEGGHASLAQSVPLIRADQVQALGLTGRGVTVAVLDSGVDTDHPDVRERLLAEQCFCATAEGTGCCPQGGTVQSGLGSAEDDHGHSTHVTGIIASAGRVAPRGVAPEAGIVAVKVLDREGRFTSSAQVLSGLDWILVTRPEVRVVNMSLGTTMLFSGACDQALAATMLYATAINTLKSRGVTVVASSGNDGSTTQMRAPACVANAVAVGAVYDANLGPVSIFGCTDPDTAADRVTCFTNSDSTLDLLAPGAAITSTGVGGATSTFFGTSQAAPHVAGAAAVLLQLYPPLTPEQIELLLKLTGVGVTDARNGLTVPRIDLLAAGAALVQLLGPSVTGRDVRGSP